MRKLITNSRFFAGKRKQKLFSLSILLLFTFICLTILMNALAGTITTNKADYAPGEIVHIPASGWKPGETIKDGGSYSLKWLAADPALNKLPYLPTYNKLKPSDLACSYPSGGVGRASNPLADAQAYAPPANSSDLDAVTSLEPKDLALCQVVPFFVELTVNGSTGPENGMINFNPYFLTKTTSGGDFGFDPAYGIYCAFVDFGEPGTIDPLDNAKVDLYQYTIGDPGGSNEQINGTIQVSGLDDGDHIFIEIWVVLKCTITDDVTGNVQTGLTDANTGPDGGNLDAISVGNQTLPLSRVHEFFSSKSDISVTKTADPVCIGDNITYNIVVTNNSNNLTGNVVANGIVATDVLGDNLTFVSASGAPNIPSGQTVTFTIGSLSPGQSANLTVVATAAATPSVDNSVTVTAITDDPDTDNNTSSITTTVYALPACNITGGLDTIPAFSSTNWCAPDDMSSYSWTGPNNFTATTQCVDVSVEGDYYVTITNANGCNSTCTRHLTLGAGGCIPTFNTTTVTQCDGTYTWEGPSGNGQIYDASVSGVTFVSKDAGGCDHTETLNLTINHSSSNTTTVTQCDGSYTWAAPLGNGQTYTASVSGVTNVSKNADGCDHTETLNLTINHSSSNTTTVTQCDGSYTWAAPLGNGQTYTASVSGVTNVSKNANGCDHTETLNLTINHSSSHTTTVIQCGGSYTWASPLGNGQTYTASVSGVTNVSTNAANCPHTETLDLTIKPLPTASIAVSAQSCTGGIATYTLTATTNGTSLTWSKPATADGSFTTTTASPTVYTPGVNDKKNGVTITLTTYLDGCSRSTTTTLTPVPCGPYYTVTQGFYGNVGGKVVTPGTCAVYTAGNKGNVDGLITLSIKNMPGQLLKLGIPGNNRTFTMGITNIEDKNLVTYLPAGQTATVITANSGSNHNTNITTNLPKLNGKKLSDVLLGQTITLDLNVYIPGNNLGSFILKTGYLTTQKGDFSKCPAISLIHCSKDATTLSSLEITTNTALKTWINTAPVKTVNDLLTLASNALGGGTLLTGVTLSDINYAVDVINRSFDGGRFVLGYYATPQSCTTLPASRATTTSITAESIPVTKLAVTAYPNPYKDEVRFRIISPQSGNATLELYDFVGRKIGVVYQGYLQAGMEKTVNYSIPALHRVQLIYRLRVGDTLMNGKLLPGKE
jgi:uncharacterized repeat protein (TIGR01451 family)